MEAIAPFLIEQSISPAKRLVLGSQTERAIHACIERSITRTLEPYSDDTELRQHLDTVLTDFLLQGGIDLFFVPDVAQGPDELMLGERFRESGGDPDTLPESFDRLFRRAATEFTREIADEAQRDGSPLFNVVSVRRIEEMQRKLNVLLQAVDSLASTPIEATLDEDTRDDLNRIGDDVRATREDMEDLRRGRRRSERVPNAKALLDGPIRALRLQGELNAADKLTDRLQAADAYGRIAVRLSEGGYDFHARLIHQKRAEALADGESIEEAFRVWLNEAGGELEVGSLWISPAVARGIDTRRAEMASSLQARADAVEALEGWYEQSVISIRVLKRALDLLIAEEDQAAPEVAVWLGEALAVDGTVEGLNLESLVTPFESLAAQSDESTSVRLRLLLAETTGDWASLIEEVSTDALSPANSGLVLCRHGRWLALQGRADEATTAYRDAIDQLAEADLLGDTAGALRSVAMVQERYIGYSDAIVDNFELAKLVSNESSRFRRSGNPRTASIESLHRASEGKHGALPNALRSGRRYLWEARISGFLSAERDAHSLIGDVMGAADKPIPALHNYILAGAYKKATKLARQSSPIDVQPFLNERAPWIVGTALAVLAAQGDYWHSEVVERIAPKLIELTTGMPQSNVSPEVHVQAWAALASVSVQLSDPLLDQVLERLEPLIEREENTYRRMDKSLLDILVQVHGFKPSRKSHAANLIAECLVDYSLMQELEGFLVSAVEEDELLRDAVVARANDSNRIASTILAAAKIDHGKVHEEAQAQYRRVLDYQVGVPRDDMAIFDYFGRAAVLSQELTLEERDSLATHLLAIANDELSPEAHRAAAVEALAELADKVSEPIRVQAFDTLLSLIDSEPSGHPIDQVTRRSLDPLSRYRFNTGMSLSREACETAGRFVNTGEQAARLLNKVMPMWQNPEKTTMATACRAILAIEAGLRPQFPIPQLAGHPLPLMRSFGLALWVDGPSSLISLADRFAADPDRSVRKQLASTVPKLAEQDKDLAQRVSAALSQDPSALVRAVAARNSTGL